LGPRVLNAAALEIRGAQTQHTKDVFDRPKSHTTDKKWLVDKARPADGDRMFATVNARPAQAEYLKFQIFGGRKAKGDVGAGPFDIYAGQPKPQNSVTSNAAI
jgi:hypothetical protein